MFWDVDVSSLVRGLIEPVVLLMLLCGVGEFASVGVDTLLPMVGCVRECVTCRSVASEVKARC